MVNTPRHHVIYAHKETELLGVMENAPGIPKMSKIISFLFVKSVLNGLRAKLDDSASILPTNKGALDSLYVSLLLCNLIYVITV